MEITWLTGLHIPSWLIADTTLRVCNIGFAVIMLAALRNIVWHDFREDTRKQHVYFGAIVLLLLMWGFKAGITPGLGFHHLGATLFLLMFGWARAILGLGIVLAASFLMAPPDWPSYGINGLLSIVLPVLVSDLVLRFSWRALPDNFFVYIFVCAFFGAAVAVAASRIAAAMVLYYAGTYPLDVFMEESVGILPLFMLPEAFITGMLITIFVVYLPDWVETFDDERYISGK